MVIKYIKDYGKYSFLISALMLILAIFLVIKPLQSISTIIIILGIILIIDGILHLISYFRLNKEYRIISFSVVIGIINILLGIVAIVLSNTLISFFPIMIAFWIIIKSIVNFQISLNLKSVNENSWIIAMIFAIITFVLGIVIIVNPFKSAALAIRIIGIVLAITEINNIIENIVELTMYK